MTDASESDVELASRLAGVVVDPDPERAAIYCMDCRTPNLVVTKGPTGPLLAIGHDTECPTYAAMTDDQRTVIGEEAALVHTCRQEVADWRERADR
ncbi:hypothetical protein ACQPZX_29415 [Actinoplanes sp. CA-142083]|uniref:hypothetical protein n=1 Tax=Actinoplanes sp. CA-142083 TaxID=3239903 RepID=UPI003D8B3694